MASLLRWPAVSLSPVAAVSPVLAARRAAAPKDAASYARGAPQQGSLVQQLQLSWALRLRQRDEASRGAPPAQGLHLQGGAPASLKGPLKYQEACTSALYLTAYFAASILLSLCNKRLFGGPAWGLPLTCCLLQQLIMSCCLLLLSSLAAVPKQQQQQQQQRLSQQQQQQKGCEVVPPAGGLEPRASFGHHVAAAGEQLPLAVPYVLMLWSSNCCLSLVSLSSYQIARSSAIPVALLLEILLPSISSHPKSQQQQQPEAAAGRLTLVSRLLLSPKALRERARAVGPLRAFSALAVAAGFAAAAADGDTLRPRAAVLGVASSVCGALYMHLAGQYVRSQRKPAADAAAVPPAAAAATAAAEASAAATADGGSGGSGGQETDSSTSCYRDSRDRGSSSEASLALGVSSLASLLLLPAVALSCEPQLLLMKLQQQQLAGELFLLLLSGCLAAFLPVCTYACLRRLSPLSCCIAGFGKTALQLLLSPLLAREAVSAAAAAGCCCCLLGSLAFCLGSIRKQREAHRRQANCSRKAE